jgi:hypothetical protein
MIRSAGGSEETLVSSVFLQNRRRCDHKVVWRLKTGIAALQAIFGDYSTELRTGTSDPDVVIPKMRARMEAAGFDELLADVQDQINEWFASDNLSQPDSDSDPPHSTYPSSS